MLRRDIFEEKWIERRGLAPALCLHSPDYSLNFHNEYLNISITRKKLKESFILTERSNGLARAYLHNYSTAIHREHLKNDIVR